MKKIITGVLALLILVGAGAAGYYFLFMKNDNNLSDSTVISENGSYVDEEIYKNLIVEADNVDIQNKSIEGSMVIKSSGSQDVFLRNVAVSGDIIIEGASEEYTLLLSNVSARNIRVNTDVPVNVKVMDSSSIDGVYTNNSIRITEDLNPKAEGIRNLVVNATSGEESPPVLDINLVNTGLDNAEVSALSNLRLDETSMIENLVVNQKTDIINQGEVGLLTANADATYLNEPAQIVVKENVKVLSSEEVAINNTTTASSRTTTTTTTTMAPDSTTTTTRTTTTTTRRVTTTTPRVTTTTTAKGNQAPVITFTNAEVNLGANFNPLQGVTIRDNEDGTIRVSEANITSNNVNTSLAGVYQVIYSYTDTGGLTTTMIRQVTVKDDTTRISAPQNITYTFDNEGDMRLTWNKVTNAYDYTVLINNRAVVTATKSNYAYIGDYLNLKNENVISVVAYPSPSSNLKESVPSSISYTYKTGQISAPERIYVNTATSIGVNFEPLYMSTKAVNKIIVKVERYENRVYVPVNNVKVGTRTTNTDGEVTITNYSRSGMSIPFTFRSSGAYRITVIYETPLGTTVSMEEVVDVYNTNGSMDDTSYATAIDEFDVDGSTSRWYISMDYSLGESLNLREANNDIKVNYFYRKIGDTTWISMGSADYYDLGFTARTTINANASHNVTINYRTDFPDLNITAFEDYLTANPDDTIVVYAQLVITRSGEDEIVETRAIRFV